MMPYSNTMQRPVEGRAVKQSEAILEASNATDDFKQAVRELRQGKQHPLVVHQWNHPAVKVFRVLLRLLDSHPDLPVARAEITGESGCSDFQGTITCLAPEPRSFRFLWDCAWKARREGYFTAFGGPDQTRAALEFGYDCFKTFTEEAAGHANG